MTRTNQDATNSDPCNEEEYDDGEDDEDEDDSDGDQDEISLSFHPITSPSLSFQSLSLAIQYDKENSNFDILTLLTKKEVDESDEEDTFFERGIILINKCRDFVSKQQQLSNDASGAAAIGTKLNRHLWSQDDGSSCSSNDGESQFFKPVLEDDAFLMSLDDLFLLVTLHTQTENAASVPSTEQELKSPPEKEESNKLLQMRISSLEEQLYLAKTCISKLTESGDNNHDSVVINNNKTSKSVNNSQRTKKEQHSEDIDTSYFGGYSHYSIHETMLRDTVRTESYQKAIAQAAHLFAGKVVLDVGCGTCVLSIFAARAGAKKVYAIDGSRQIAHSAKIIVEESGYGNIIQVVHTKVEDWHYPEEEEKADVLVSEWMGYALLFESMLPSVLYARDNLMKKEETRRLVYPNRARIYIEGASDDRLLFWNDVYGINMKSMRRNVEMELTTMASVEIVEPDKIVTDRQELVGFDMNTVKDEELDFKVDFCLTSSSSSASGNEGASISSGSKKIDKLVISFDMDFVESNVSFSTGSQSQPTHWKQSVLWLDSIVAPTLVSGETFCGTFKMARNKVNERAMDFDVKWEVRQKGGEIRSDGSIKSTLTV